MKHVMVASVHHKERKHPSELQQLTREQRRDCLLPSGIHSLRLCMSP